MVLFTCGRKKFTERTNLRSARLLLPIRVVDLASKFSASTAQRCSDTNSPRSLCSPRHYGLFNPAAFDRGKRAEPRSRAFCTCHASVRRGLRRQRQRGVCHFICLITPARSPVRILAGQCLWCIHLRREKAKSICT